MLHNQFDIIPFDKKFAEDMANCESLSLGEEAWTSTGIAETVNLNGTYFIAAENGQYRGHGGYTRVLDEYYITNVAVLPEFWRKGIATAIMQKMISTCKEENGAFITLEVRESNAAAIKLYEKLGFVTKGRRKQFYSAPNEDAVIMTLEF